MQKEMFFFLLRLVCFISYYDLVMKVTYSGTVLSKS